MTRSLGSAMVGVTLLLVACSGGGSDEPATDVTEVVEVVEEPAERLPAPDDSPAPDDVASALAAVGGPVGEAYSAVEVVPEAGDPSGSALVISTSTTDVELAVGLCEITIETGYEYQVAVIDPDGETLAWAEPEACVPLG